MKLMSLNIWGGYVKEPLLEFIQRYSDIDIFCFQEVYHNAPKKISADDKDVCLDIFSQLHQLLPNYQAFFRPVVNGIYGIGTFVRDGIDVLGEGEVKIHENPFYMGRGPTHSRNLQWIECNIDNKIYSVINVHGLWNGNGKTDTPERIAQSQRIKSFLNTINVPMVVCGDFNLRPDTQSLRIIEEGLVNLVKTHNITSTRSRLYPKEERFADYVFVSPEIKVVNFSVLDQAEVSDHLPLILCFQ